MPGRAGHANYSLITCSILKDGPGNVKKILQFSDHFFENRSFAATAALFSCKTGKSVA